MKKIGKTNNNIISFKLNNIISFKFIMIFSLNPPNLQTYQTAKFQAVKKLNTFNNMINFNMTKNINVKPTPPTPTPSPVTKINPSPVIKRNTFFPILNIVHNMGGGTQVYVDNLANIFNIDHQLNIVNENLFELKIRNNKKKYTCNTNKLLQNISNDTIVVFHHLLTMDFKLNKTLFYNIHNGCYKKLIFIIHDYHLLFPSTPNPIKNKMIDKPTNDNLLFTNDLFKKCDLIVFNSHNCLNNYKKYINIDSYNNCIVTNTVPDILINNSITFPPMKKIYNIGIIGHINAQHKGQQLLIKINNTLSDQKYCFKIFGYSNVKDNIYKNNVQLYGDYNNNDIFNLIKKHNIDFFMFISTFEETYSYTLSIAMQTGLPIFYNNIGCYHERLLGRQNVYAFDEDNLTMIEELVKKMEIDSCNNKDSIKKMKIDAICKHEVFSQNADYNWIISNNENVIFNIKSIEKHLIYKNVCFFHFTNIGKGYEIFLEQISNIKTSGLYEKLDFIFVTMLGPHIKLCEDPKIKVVYYSPNELEWEFPTIKLIKSFSDNVNNKKINLLYMHNKGVLNKKYAKEWRDYLSHFLIFNHHTCLHYLNEGRDCVGVNINLHGGANYGRCHFSGNFWWSNTNYIKLLPLFVNKQDRYATEHYLIGNYYSKYINAISLHNCENNLYENPLFPETYNYSIIKNKVLDEYNNFNIENYKKIICIYFVSTINTSSEYRFFKQINKILNSGFYDACKQIICFITGSNKNIVTKLSKLTKVRMIQTNENLMEKFCLNNYKQYISNIEDYNVVYFHTKGASHPIEKKSIDDWCELCNYFTIDLWKLNIILLTYYSCIGVNLMSYPFPHFSGNYWWATGTHLSKLKENIGYKYLDSEMYVLNNIHFKDDLKLYQPNPLCLFKSIASHAANTYDEKLYKNLTIEEILNKIPENYTYNNKGDNIEINYSRTTSTLYKPL
jgi:hypothetical protein